MGLAVSRLRDVGNITIDGDPLGCAQSVTITLDSEVLRARCGFAISERYQGITGLSLEVVVETLNPFADFHPGDFGILVVEIPSADPASGLPGLPDKLTMEGVITNVVRRFVRNELSTGTYTFRGISSDGIECPIEYEPGAGGGVISLGEPEDFIRDIRSFTFGAPVECITTEEFCAESVEITEATELIEDSCQGQLWPTYVGITGLNVTVTATGKGIFHAFDCAAGAVPGFSTCLGSKGTIEIGVAVGSAVDCAALVDDGRLVRVKNANVTSLTITATHGEIATISLTWTGHGEEGEALDPTLRAIAEIIGA